MPKNNLSISVYRILDAAINRCAEGLRVVEDYLRMDLADQFLAGQLKQLRHQLTEATRELDPQQRMEARDSQNDVGRENKTEAEFERVSPTAMVQANLARAQQAIRTIEEFSKTISGSMAKRVEQLRYETYTVEKAVLTTMMSRQNLANAQLYVLIGYENIGDAAQNKEAFSNLAQQLIVAGVDLIQFREKHLSDRLLLEAGQQLTHLCRDSNTRWIMNDRVDIALVAGADGVHLGQDDLTVSHARRILGANRLVGVSTHNIDQARAAVREGANYIGVGPVFESRTKKFESFSGLEYVRQVASEIQLPAFGIGGIDLSNIDCVMAEGLTRVAVSNAVVHALSPGQAAKELLGKLRPVKC